ncbi:Hypothetical protein, predicted transmembrane protein [Metamycoplasma auris 15026]|uniref:SGNH hydrolase-type esterase domain-containing protein n=1 Tax=Metamycoplasma auris 15026 TaxID=1188233 RepID=N9TRS3_9BACT|nr:hypothetical protein [Metamycoplasma auris]ENY68760.1 Hypothetical protein, predicted transmembrane protein [Metamycoplasma auris 15026]
MEEINKSKIRYIALGDAFAAGYNSKIGFPTNGYLNKNQKINGLDYPTTLASLIANNKHLELESFYNFSFAIGNLDFLQAIYTNNKKEILKNGKIIDLIQAIDWFASNPFKNFFSSFLNDWNIKNNDFGFLTNKIKEANLISITAGFFDFFNKLPFKKILALNKLSKEKRGHSIVEIKEDIEKIKEEISLKLISLIKSIKTLNNKAKIFITNYPQLLFNLKHAINSYINENQIKSFDLYEYIKRSLNSIMELVANKSAIDFIDIDDFAYWNENYKYLFENIFSFFPSEKGYKKIGMDIYSKLFLSKDSFNEQIKNGIFLDKYITNKEYWTNNFSNYIPLVKKIDTEALFKFVYGNNKNENIYLMSANENKYHTYLNYKIRVSDFLTLFLRYYGFLLFDLVKKFITDKFGIVKDRYKFIQSVIEFTTNEQRAKQVILIFLKNQKLDNILYILEQSIFKRQLNSNFNLHHSIILAELISILRHNQYLVYDVLKYFFNSQLITEAKNEINHIIQLFIKESLNSDLLNYFFNFKGNNKFKNIINYVLSLNSFKDFVTFFLESLINYANIYITLKNFDELWANFIIKNKYNILLLLDKILVELTEETKIQESIDFFSNSISDLLRLEIESKDYKQLKNAITNILNILKSNPKYLNNLGLKLLDRIKDISLYDLIFLSKENKKKILKWTNFISINKYLILGFQILKNLFIIRKIIKKYKI